MPYLQNATDFLLQAVIAFALYLVLLRFWMQWVRADFRNPLGQVVISATNPLVIPLRKILPAIGTIDTATVALAFMIALIKIAAYVMLRNMSIPPLYYLSMGLGVIIQYSIYLLLAAIFIQIIASWISPTSYHPIVSIARAVADPILAPARRLIPPLGGLDLSPILVILFLQFSLRLFVHPLLPLPI